MLNGHRDIEQSSSNGSFVPSLNSADGGLSIIIGLLDALGIKYWIDSGILLGLARSGAINAWEKDIDLGAVSNEIGRVLKSRKYFIEAGYQVSINRYRGLVYSINLIPAYISSTKNFPVAIHFYYEVGDYLWSPQTQIYMPSPSPDVYSKKRSLIGSFLCGIITRIMYASSSNQKDVHLNGVPKASGQRKSISKRIIGWLYHKFDKGFLAETWPISEIFVPFTWIIPKQLVFTYYAK